MDFRRIYKIIGSSGFIILSFFISLKAEATVLNNKPDDIYRTNGYIRSMIKDGDGNVYVGGGFTEVTNSADNINGFIALDKNSGTPSLADLKINGTVQSSVSDGQGGVYIGGFFNSVSGQTRNHIAHIKANGELDPDFHPDVSGLMGFVRTILLSGNDLYIGGNFTSVNGQPRNYMAKLNAVTGDLDPNFSPNFNSYVDSMAILDSYLYVGGYFTAVGTTTRSLLARFSLNGELDASFNPSLTGTFVDSLVASGSSVYAVGTFSKVGAQTRSNIAKFNTDGSLDASFNPSFNAWATSLIFSGSDIYVGGTFTTVASAGTTTAVTHNRLAKLNAAGIVDDSFNPNFNGTVNYLENSGSDIYAGGDFTTVASAGTTTAVTHNRLAKLNAAGIVDGVFVPNFNAGVFNLVISGSVIYVGGSFSSLSLGQTRNYIAKFKPDGTLDPIFAPSFNSFIYTLALSGSDLYAGGLFTTAASSTADTPITLNRLAKLNKDTGAIDSSFTPSFNNYVQMIALSGSDIYAGGAFTTVASAGTTTAVTHNRLAKLNTAGIVDDSFNPNFNSTVVALSLSGSDIYAGGAFTTVASAGTTTAVTHNRLAKLNTAGIVDHSFSPNFNNAVAALSLFGSDLYIAGSFTGVTPYSSSTPVVNYIAKLDKTSGSVYQSFAPNFDYRLIAITAFDSGVYVGGLFTNVNSVHRNYLVKLDTAGNIDTNFSPIFGVYSPYCFLTSDSKIYVGGAYSPFLVRFSPDTLAPVLTLNGASAVTIDGGQSYSDAGATALDANFGDLTSSIITDNPVDVSVPRTYTVSYTVSDIAGNSSAITRLVTVRITGNSLPEGALKSPEQLVSSISGSATTTLRFSINDNIPFTTNNRLVSLRFDNFGNSLIDRIAISSSADFKDASLISYVPIHQYDLCTGAAICPDGVYTVYAKYFSSWGQPSETASLSISLERKKVDGQKIISQSPTPSAVSASLSSRLSGRILLQVESHGEAWYVNPLNRLRYYLGRPADAYALMRDLGLGASSKDISSFLSSSAPSRLAGRILIQVQDKGQAYYVNPSDLKLYYLGRPDDAYALMRAKGLGITDKDLMKIGEGSNKSYK